MKRRVNQHVTRVRGRGAFTLIEILLVVLIIAILAALLLPAIAALRRAAEKNRASSRAQAMVHAVKAYRFNYSRWPGQTQGAVDVVYDDAGTGRWHRILLGALTNNPRRIFFSDVVEGIKGTNYMDSWGRPFLIGIDENNDGIVAFTGTCGTVTFATNVRERVAVVSWGRNPSNPADRICSWIR